MPLSGRAITKSPRVVLDTNCLISALLFRSGKLGILPTLWYSMKIIPISCSQTENELAKVLHYPKFALSPKTIQELLEAYIPWTEKVHFVSSTTQVSGLVDQNDAIFIHLAQEANADFLVSGDNHILGIANQLPELHIVSPADFLLMLDC